MQEKDMMNDVLTMVNSSVGKYGDIITQCNNQQLRQTLQQKRNGDEQYQYQLYEIASQKGYYKPAVQATQEEIQQVKSQLSQC
ncbi:spore coat protein [Clostridium botulinum C]|uniref:Spore coat protein n=5 Tax=Clostridium TaxID=1485 RepID=A0A9Q4TQ42_CLOBO|nr:MULTISPECIES: spore coat protein [Clostridium]AYF54367.1 spore coat protein [Clostridium novyi]EES90453.1 spore coat protein F [Clostridium botulinum D str. 1873]KEI06896.1 coat protein F [Clostridium sp. K25]KEI13732.1 coat protein F [Clostridium novyi B str. ATCC 27606]KEI15678.1 coat protein F [Clostridium haemolyticum NCTC 9693]